MFPSKCPICNNAFTNLANTNNTNGNLCDNCNILFVDTDAIDNDPNYLADCCAEMMNIILTKIRYFGGPRG